MGSRQLGLWFAVFAAGINALLLDLHFPVVFSLNKSKEVE